MGRDFGGLAVSEEALTEGLLKLQEKMMTERWLVRAPNGNGNGKQVAAA